MSIHALSGHVLDGIGSDPLSASMVAPEDMACADLVLSSS